MDYVVNRKRKFDDGDDSSSFGRPHATYFQYLPYELQGYLGLYAGRPIPTDAEGRHVKAICDMEKAYDKVRWEELMRLPFFTLTYDLMASADFRRSEIYISPPGEFDLQIIITSTPEFDDRRMRLPPEFLPTIRRMYEEGLLELVESRWIIGNVRPTACFEIPGGRELLSQTVQRASAVDPDPEKRWRAWRELLDAAVPMPPTSSTNLEANWVPTTLEI